MLQACFGIYIVLALFAFLIVLGTVIKAHQYDERNDGV